MGQVGRLYHRRCVRYRARTDGRLDGSLNELMEARDERRLIRLQKQVAAVKLLIVDELGFVPLCRTGAELLFEMISQRCRRGATLIASNLVSLNSAIEWLADETPNASLGLQPVSQLGGSSAVYC